MSLKLLCIDDDQEFLIHLQLELENAHEVLTAKDIAGGMSIIANQDIDAVLLDIGLGEADGISSGLKPIHKKYPQLPVVMLTAYNDTQTVVRAVREGALDYVCKPFEIEELIAVLKKIEEAKNLREQNEALIATLNNNYSSIPMAGKSWGFKKLIKQASMVKGYNANILIEGESGTGKELLAQYIRNLEDNPNRPFIAINCAAIPQNLIESELFGHEKGSFTSAIRRKIGSFELANGGDIFLDEISSLPMDLQAKILRAIQEHTFCRIGSNEQIRSDFRVIAATNVNLEEMIEKNLFRLDLYHRLKVVHLKIPPLRERKEDIPELIQIFMEKHSKNGNSKTVSDDAKNIITEHAWPGNIRELENFIQSLIIMTPHNEITTDDLPSWLTNKPTDSKTSNSAYINMKDFDNVSLKDFLKVAERAFIDYILKKNNGHRQQTAEELGTARSTFYLKLKELNIL